MSDDPVNSDNMLGYAFSGLGNYTQQDIYTILYEGSHAGVHTACRHKWPNADVQPELESKNEKHHRKGIMSFNYKISLHNILRSAQELRGFYERQSRH